MRILVGKTFGIGNACLSIPMIKALHSMGHSIDVLIGSGPDDFGARAVFAELRQNTEVIHHIYLDSVPFDVSVHDIAIMSIPYDGRWKNGLHFFASKVIDGRKRPDNIEELGFHMWHKHEVEYQMDNARELGYDGPTPDGNFLGRGIVDPDLVYLGLGYKRDEGGFGLSKHYGTMNYVRLIDDIRRDHPAARFVTTGNMRDVVEVSYAIQRMLEMSAQETEFDANEIPKVSRRNVSEFFDAREASLSTSFELMKKCGSYIGNDTGMMHVAASLDIPTVGLMAYKDLTVKNPPFCTRSRCILFRPDHVPSYMIAKDFVDFVWSKK